MDRREFKILIVEDDQTLGKAIAELIRREGYTPIHVSKPDEAIPQMKLQTIHLAIVDCMLPKMNGRDLAVKLRAESGGDMPIILMSGIYKDKAYIRESTQQTGAFAYMIKPFNLDDLKSLIDEKLKSEHTVETRMMPIYNLMAQSTISAKERIDAINESDTVHGYDLPWLYSLLLEEKVRGHLNIISSDGSIAGVGFDSGHIVQVNMADEESYFGVLLVEKGYVTAKELEAVIKSTSKGKRIGERLVELNLLSPHAIELILAEQHGIRLSKTVEDTSNKVNFIPSDDVKGDTFISKKMFTEFLDDWILSKVKPEWLKAYYVPWMNHNFAKGSENSDNHRALSLVNVNNLPGFLTEVFRKGMTLESLLVRYDGQEQYAFRALHMAIMSRIVCFGSAVRQRDFESQAKRFEHLKQEMIKQNYFERLGISTKAKETEVKRAYLDLAKVLHPDKLLPETPNHLRELVTSAFEMVTQAYQTLSNNDARLQYVMELENGNAEQVLIAENLMENGKIFLRKGDIKAALQAFEASASKAPPTTELKLCLLWARLKSAQFVQNVENIAKAKEDLSKIPPEDRHSPVFYFVKGLYLKSAGDLDTARKSFEHAISIDSNFIEARRELNLIKHEVTATKVSNKDLLNADLKDVVTMLFNTKIKKTK